MRVCVLQCLRMHHCHHLRPIPSTPHSFSSSLLFPSLPSFLPSSLPSFLPSHTWPRCRLWHLWLLFGTLGCLLGLRLCVTSLPLVWRRFGRHLLCLLRRAGGWTVDSEGIFRRYASIFFDFGLMITWLLGKRLCRWSWCSLSERYVFDFH